MHVQSILRRLHPLPGFVYGKVSWSGTPGRSPLHVHVRPRRGAKGVCSGCGKKRPGYDMLNTRVVHVRAALGRDRAASVRHAARRLPSLRRHRRDGPVGGRQDGCDARVRLVPRELGEGAVLEGDREALSDELGHRVPLRRARGPVGAHRSLEGITAIGVDELAWKKRHKYLTLVYQLDPGARRLLYIARHRTAKSFNAFFDDVLGKERSERIVFVASDLWKGFLGVVRTRCSSALHVLDRFHVVQLLSKAVDTVRRAEVKSLRAAGRPAFLTKARWLLLKRRDNLNSDERGRLRQLLTINLRSVRACLLKEQFDRFWNYRSPAWADRFLTTWTSLAMRSRLEPLKKFARTLRAHRRLLLNWFAARGRFPQGAVEGFNNKARVTTRKAYGFRDYDHARIALYHALGALPEPPWLTHRFC